MLSLRRCERREMLQISKDAENDEIRLFVSLIAKAGVDTAEIWPSWFVKMLRIELASNRTPSNSFWYHFYTEAALFLPNNAFSSSSAHFLFQRNLGAEREHPHLHGRKSRQGKRLVFSSAFLCFPTHLVCDSKQQNIQKKKRRLP